MVVLVECSCTDIMKLIRIGLFSEMESPFVGTVSWRVWH